jgi:hypothetical protein
MHATKTHIVPESTILQPLYMAAIVHPSVLRFSFFHNHNDNNKTIAKHCTCHSECFLHI